MGWGRALHLRPGCTQCAPAGLANSADLGRSGWAVMRRRVSCYSFKLPMVAHENRRSYCFVWQSRALPVIGFASHYSTRKSGRGRLDLSSSSTFPRSLRSSYLSKSSTFGGPGRLRERPEGSSGVRQSVARGYFLHPDPGGHHVHSTRQAARSSPSRPSRARASICAGRSGSATRRTSTRSCFSTTSATMFRTTTSPGSRGTRTAASRRSRMSSPGPSSTATAWATAARSPPATSSG